MRAGKDVQVKSTGLFDCLTLAEELERLDKILPDEGMWMSLAESLK